MESQPGALLETSVRCGCNDVEKAMRGMPMSPHGIPYNLSVLTYSDLQLLGRVSQTSLEPGALVTLRATLTEYALPVTASATMTADVERPECTATSYDLSEPSRGFSRRRSRQTKHRTSDL
jgi:hypothetical protein